jgi:hypothetical protein
MPDTMKSLRARIRELEAERLLLAKMAMPQHPNGGFHNPLIAWEVQSLAERVLAAPTLREAAHV